MILENIIRGHINETLLMRAGKCDGFLGTSNPIILLGEEQSNVLPPVKVRSVFEDNLKLFRKCVWVNLYVEIHMETPHGVPYWVYIDESYKSYFVSKMREYIKTFEDEHGITWVDNWFFLSNPGPVREGEWSSPPNFWWSFKKSEELGLPEWLMIVGFVPKQELIDDILCKELQLLG